MLVYYTAPKINVAVDARSQQAFDILPSVLACTRSVLTRDVFDEHKIVGAIAEVQDLAQRLLLQHAGARDVADAIHTQAPWKQEPVRDEAPYVRCNAGVLSRRR